MKLFVLSLSIFVSATAFAQSQAKRALFLGNSYTAVNNLPQLVADMAASTGDTLIFDSNTPGGYTLEGHFTNTTSLSKIMAGNWDYVVLQEQSQRPSFPISQVEAEVFPYARGLDSIINQYNVCAETVFYMTWGRKNGDAANCASWPPVCTYAGMDSLLNLRYRMMADSNDALLSPVGAVWKYIRQNFPLIELYQSDESHPSLAGSYAAACSFYTTFFRKDPALITFNSGLPAGDAANIRSAARAVVYDSLIYWHVGEYDPLAGFTYSVSGMNEITFVNTSANAATWYWSFGDGDTSTAANPVHTYPSAGPFTVTLIAEECSRQDSITQTVNVTAVISSPDNDKLPFTIYPNPASNQFTLLLNIQGGLSKCQVTIYSSVGNEVYRSACLETSQQTIKTNLSSGIYFVRLAGNDGMSVVKKLVIE
jgi:hypothetical protein